MEHQSSVIYVETNSKGYLETTLLELVGAWIDFIIIHEVISWMVCKQHHLYDADMWIHESFTAYSESLFLDYYYGMMCQQRLRHRNAQRHK
jgi:hypothetical protein